VNVEPLAISLVNDAIVQLSNATAGDHVTTVPFVVASAYAVISDGQVIVGAMLSTTVTVWVAVAVLPEPSVTVQVTVVFPNEKLVGASLVVLDTLQLSEVVGVPRLTFAKAVAHVPASTFTVTSVGAVITGTSLSSTVTSKEHTVELPAASVTVAVTVVVPTAKTSPLLWLQTVVYDPLLSKNVGAVHVTTALQLPASLSWVMSAGQFVITGLTVSNTVTVNVHVTKFPLWSVAV
jgi:hypothetical protein